MENSKALRAHFQEQSARTRKFRMAGFLVGSFSNPRSSNLVHPNGLTTSRYLRSTRRLSVAMDRHKMLEMETRIPEESEDDNEVSIWKAARTGNIAFVRKLLDNDPDVVDQPNTNGVTALHIAVHYKKYVVIEELLRCGADVNRPVDVSNVKPLHVSVRNNNTDIVKLLLQYGAEINAKEIKGLVPLHIAARRGHLDILKLLLKSEGADPNIQDNDSMTPLHQAAINGDVSICKLLIEHGADTRAKDINGMTPLMQAAVGGFCEIMSLLIETAGRAYIPIPDCDYLTDADNEGSTVLHLAVSNNNMEATKLCLEYGADIDLRKGNNTSSLHIAAVNGYLDIATLLIDRGAKVNARDDEYMTPLHRAAMYNRVELIKILLQNRAMIEAPDQENFTPLLTSVWRGQVEAGKYLIEHGANILAKDVSGKTCLHWAVEGNYYKYVEMLLTSSDGDANLVAQQDSNHQTPLHYAAEIGNDKLLKVLILHGASLDAKDEDEKSPLHIAARHGQLGCVKILLRNKPTLINEDDVEGRTPLLLASLHAHRKVVEYLLRFGADVSSRDNSRMSALALAASVGNSDICRILISSHIDMEYFDKNKNRALHHSAASGHVAVTEILLKKGASVLAENEQGHTPLEIAIENMQRETSLAMIKHESWRTSLGHLDRNGYPPMRRVVEKLPEVAAVILDQCTTYSHPYISDPDLEVTYDYSFISWNPNTDTKYWQPLSEMAEYDREHLLQHELTRRLTQYKWKKFGRVFYFVDFTMYSIFLVLLTVYVGMNTPIQTTQMVEFGNELCPNQTDWINEHGERVSKSESGMALSIILYVYLCIRSLSEILRISQQKLRYLIRGRSWTAWSLNITVAVYIGSPNFVPCTAQWGTGAFAVLIAWINFIIFLQRISVIGIYVTMFFTVLKSVSKAIVMFLFFVFAFANSFYLLLSRLQIFSNMRTSFVTVVVMTLGELDYREIFFNSSEDLYPFHALATVMFCLFMFVMPIVMMNLLTGIAVGDIDAIKENATMALIQMEVESVDKLESYFPKMLQRKCYLQKEVVYPNKNISKRKKWMKKTGLTFKLISTPKSHSKADINKKSNDSLVLEKITGWVEKIEKR